MTMIAIVVHNITRIITGIQKLADMTKRAKDTSIRQRRRTDELRNRLPHHTTAQNCDAPPGSKRE
ncbi:hypothetical protein MUN77_15665 [Leucobacter allii]|uniref:hypothetical protein n=1 Tax=Leucobacter allii TaxID=2932247 RepID=UPI001FD28BD4|nr:hypothetical protein [Leucobacter allii]UOR01543.1 hypothetical protein MUN77_15665 [Leucobacter allii]